MRNPVVSLKIGGLSFYGWKSLRAETGVEQCAGAFELGVMDRFSEASEKWAILPGDPCELQINEMTIVTGFVDSVRPSFDKSAHGIAVSGRDATMDLIDCAAIYKTGQWKNTKLDRIARDLAKPFGIEVVVENGVDIGAAFDSFNIEEGERAFEAIDRAARSRAVLVATDGSGRLLLTTPSTKKAPIALVQGENVLHADLNLSWKERFSQITVKGQGKGDAEQYGEKVAHGSATVTDKAINRYRPLIVVAEQHGSSPTLKARAEWEQSVRRGRGTRASVKVQGWTYVDESAADGESVWKPNMLVEVDLPYLGLHEDLLISKCHFDLSENGTTTTLELVHPSALKLLANVKGTRLNEKIKGRNGVESSGAAKDHARKKLDGDSCEKIDAKTGLASGDC